MSQPESDPAVEYVASNEAAAQAVVGHHFHLSTGLIQRVETLLECVDRDHRHNAEEARQDLQGYMRREILPHARAEEAVLYPPAAATPDGQLLVEGMVDEHHALAALEQELASAGSLVRAAAAARAVAALFGTHVHKENNLVLPLLVGSPDVALAELLAGMQDLLGDPDDADDHAAAVTTAQAAGGCGGDGACGCGGDRPATSAPALAPVLSVDTRLDVREVPHDQRHPLVLSTVAALSPGEAVVLIASHAPRPVLAEVDDRFGGQVEMHWLQAGPEIWQVRLERLAV